MPVFRHLLAVFILCASGLAAADNGAEQAQLVAQGKRMYREGILPSGSPMRATLKGDVPFGEGQTACVGCHRRSGQGTSEGLTQVSPLTSAWLYQPRHTGIKKQAFVARGGRQELRPAYTDETLARAIREGVDAGGRELAQPMPRYDLSDEQLKPLIAYLKTLSTSVPPGVSDREIHFATVVSDGVEPSRRKAMMSVLEAYFHDRNEGAGRRKWRLHVWHLRGPARTWTAQLEAYYRKQPVFAMLSGISAGNWRPIDEFCERQEIPCLFPNTDLPKIADNNYYTLYFSKGTALEGEALASYLRSQPDQRPGTIVQVSGDDEWSISAAQALRKSLGKFGIDSLRDVHAASTRALTPDFWRHALDCGRPGVVVIWQADPDLQGLKDSGCGDKLRGIYVSSSRKSEAFPPVPNDFRDRIYLVHPFDVDKSTRQRYRNIERWLAAKHVEIVDRRLQANTFVAIATAGDAVTKLDDNFSREYLMEQIEDMGDNAAVSPVYPNFSLGPNQRFASKGSYIVKMMTSGVVFPVSGWIVP